MYESQEAPCKTADRDDTDLRISTEIGVGGGDLPRAWDGNPARRRDSTLSAVQVPLAVHNVHGL